jgi:Na+/phosphate symporter
MPVSPQKLLHQAQNQWRSMKIGKPNILRSPQSKIILLVGLSSTFSLFAIGCAETKVSQCQKIVEMTKTIATESQNNRDTTDLQKVLQMADRFEETADNMEKMVVQDAKLSEYKVGFAEVYRGHAEATREFIDGLQNKDITKARSSQQRVKDIGKREQQLVTQMNSYCQEN